MRHFAFALAVLSFGFVAVFAYNGLPDLTVSASIVMLCMTTCGALIQERR
jgi:hypothetical protein